MSHEDFKSIYDVEPLDGRIENRDFASLTFLMVKLWANIEIIHREALSVSIAKDKRGKQLQSFMNHLSSRRTRLVDRISQRAIGELMLTRHHIRSPGNDFVHRVRTAGGRYPEAQRWLKTLAQILSQHTTHI